MDDGVKVRCLTDLANPQCVKLKMGRLRGFEPPNAGVTILCLNHLTTTARYGASLGIRTPDLRLRRPLLYPAELVTRILSISEALYEISLYR